ncbi:MAG TPA: acyl-CoA dehydrogenase family protein [Acidimicrobiia bacterium]
MDPHDSPAEAAFRAEARAFLDANAVRLPPTALALSSIVAEWSPEEEAARLDEAKRWQAVKHAAGWAGISWPEEYGGRGGSLVENLIYQIEESEFDVPHDALLVGLGWCGPAVLQHGDEAQRRRLLPPLLRGDEVWCQLFSEPAAGSDLAGLSTRAVRDGDDWVIDGQKVWTTFAHRSDWGLCIARHDPDAARNAGLTAFMVDMRADGVSARPIRQITNSSNFNEVFLDGVRVPDTMRIGEVGDGWRVVVSTFMWERFNVITGGSRVIPGLADLLRHTGASTDPIVRERYAGIYSRAEALRGTLLRLMTALSRGRLPGPEGSVMKLVATDLLTDIFDVALAALGPAGMGDGSGDAWDGQWHSGFAGAPGMRIGGGTDFIQRNIIAERVLGLPRDPR